MRYPCSATAVRVERARWVAGGQVAASNLAAGDSRELAFRVLGPVLLFVAGRPVVIDSAHQRVVFTVLLLAAGRTVTVDRLVDAIWYDDPPATARNQVQRCISQLRKRLNDLGVADLIATRSAGYVMRDPGPALDLHRFRDCVEAATAVAAQQPDMAVLLYRDALNLWHGDAAEDVPGQAVQSMATRLNEERLVAVERCIDLELRLGRHREVVGELMELVASHPLREPFRALLMRALSESGRQADALSEYQSYREFKRDEVGLDPGDELKTLEEAILAGHRGGTSATVAGITASNAALGLGDVTEPIASRLAPVPRQLPSAVPGFVGRRDLVRRIGRALTSTASQVQLGIVVLTGRGGVGKTALALTAAHDLLDDFPDGQLYVEFQSDDDSGASASPLLAGLLRSLGIGSAVIPDKLADRAAMYRSWLAEKRVLVVLDNVSRADQAMPLLPGAPGCGVIITSRSLLTRLSVTERVHVGPLNTESSVELLTQMVGPERANSELRSLRRLAALCDGIPLALRIIGAKLAIRPHQRIQRIQQRLADRRRRLDELELDGANVRATLAYSYQTLSGESRRLLRLLAIIGTPEFAYWVAIPITGCSAATAEDLLDGLVSANLLEARATPGGIVRYRIHDLVRLYAEEMLAQTESVTERRTVLRRYVGGWLALAEEAHRRAFGGDFEVVHGSADRWGLPGRVIDEVLADPVRWFHDEGDNLIRVIRLAASAGLDEACWDLTVTSVTLFESAAFAEAWIEAHDVALAAVQAADDLRGAAAVRYSLGHVLSTRDLPVAAGHLQWAANSFREVGDVHGAALALRDLASVERHAGEFGSAVQHYQEALRYLRQVGDRTGQASVLRNLARIKLGLGDCRAAEDLLAAAVELAREAGAGRTEMQARCHLAELRWLRGDADADQALRAVIDESLGMDDVLAVVYGRLLLGRFLAARGEIELALAELRAAASAADDAGVLVTRGETQLAVAEAEFAARNVESARASANAALTIFIALGSPLWRGRCLALIGSVSEQQGDMAGASRHWHQAAELAGDSDPPLATRLADRLSRAAEAGSD